ncbi:MAG: ATP-grasp domain-containing protein [bacterium]
MKKIGAVITGGDFQGLGVLRSLARRNIPVYLIDNDLCIGRFSRFNKKFAKSPQVGDEDHYLDFLINLAKRERLDGWVIFPNSDEIVSILSRHKKQLEKYYRIPTPAWQTTKYVYNKKLTYQLANKIGIPIPKTYYPQSLEEIRELELEFPVIIKPAIRDHFYNKTKVKAYWINNREKLIQYYQKVRSVIDPSEILVQEFIPGGPKHLFSFCPLFKEGWVLARISGRRTRQHPMDFGHATTFAELVELPELEAIGSKFLKEINYYGLAEVEFMQDPRDGIFKFIEVNPRVWGWHTLAIGAGVDLPYLLYQDMIGKKVEAKPAVENLKWFRLTTDIATVFSEIIKNHMKVKDYVISLKGKKTFAVFSLEDPIPFFMEIIMIPYLWRKRGF